LGHTDGLFTIRHTPAPRAAAGDKDADAHTKHAAPTAAASTEQSAHLRGSPHLGTPHQGDAPASRGKGKGSLSQLNTYQPNTEPAVALPAKPAEAAAGGPQEAEGTINAISSIKSSKPSSSQAFQAKLYTRELQSKLCIREDCPPSRSRDFSREESLKGIFSSDRQQGHQAPFPSRHGRKGSGRQRPTQEVRGHQAALSPFRHHARDKDANCPHNEVIKSPPLNVNVKEEFAYDLPKTASESDQASNVDCDWSEGEDELFVPASPPRDPRIPRMTWMEEYATRTPFIDFEYKY
jgi:hypothetical protein